MSNADIRGRFVWHELVTTDTDAAGAFYSKVVPWKTQASGMPGYTLWVMGKNHAGGLMALPEDSAGAAPHWLTFIGTPSVDSTLEGIQRLGGKVLKGATDIPNVGKYAIASDPQGVTFALYTPAAGSADGAAAPGDAAPGACSWHELATTDVNGAVSFYSELFGWEKGPTHPMGGDMGDYQLLTLGGQQIGGVYKSSPGSMPPSWLTYVNVADIDKATSAVKGGGGRIINGPMQVPGGSWIAQATDPQGGMFAVIEVAPMTNEQPAKAAAKPATGKSPKPAAAKSAKATAAEAKPAASAPAAANESPKSASGKPAGGAKPAAATKAAGPKKAGKQAVKKAAGKAAKKKAPKPAQRAAAKRGKKAASARRGGKAPAKGKAKGKTRAKAKSRRR
jgi:uncharacterized protein